MVWFIAMISISKNTTGPEMATDLLEAVIRRDRLVVMAGLAAVMTIAWVWLLFGAGIATEAASGMPDMPGMAGMMAPAAWSLSYAALMAFMWWTMMTAMMLPGAAPTLLLFARINRNERNNGRPYVPTGAFAGGYLVVWGGFSLMATGLQWWFENLGLMTSMTATSLWLSGAILIGAGVWQFTPIKSICLRHCRSPLSFLSHRWRPGRTGAMLMGLEHGAYCLGCCWFLMGILFFGGIMNLYWIIGLAAFVLVEKTVRIGNWIGRVAGLALTGWGIFLLTSAAVR
jgi:predicted metal-binding membrane protein